MYRRNIQPAHMSFVLVLLVVPLLAGAVCAQTTVFTYQGRLTEGGTDRNTAKLDGRLILIDGRYRNEITS